MLSGAATTKLTAPLEATGLIEPSRSDRDGRVVMLRLTEEGRQVVETQLPICIDEDRAFIGGLDDDELATLAELLRKVSANAERAVQD